MHARLTPALLVAATLGGCRPAPPAGVRATVGESNGTKTWSMPSDGTGVPGLDGGTVYFVGTRFVVWAADGRGGGGGGTSDSRTGSSGDGRVMLTGDRTVPFTYSLPAGQPGTATVNGTAYNLADGRVFLVKPDGDKLVVKQVAVDLPGVNLGEADLAALGRATPAIRAFFEPKR